MIGAGGQLLERSIWLGAPERLVFECQASSSAAGAGSGQPPSDYR